MDHQINRLCASCLPGWLAGWTTKDSSGLVFVSHKAIERLKLTVSNSIPIIIVVDQPVVQSLEIYWLKCPGLLIHKTISSSGDDTAAQ